MNISTAQPELFDLPMCVSAAASDEWYTPAVYVEAARRVMGNIGLDPASNHTANETIRAANYYTVENDGLRLPFYGNVWCNPPYSNPAPWVARIKTARLAGKVTQAILLVPPSIDTEWFHDAISDVTGAMCIVRGRIRFYRADGRRVSTPRQGNVFIYYGDRIMQFRREFGEFGRLFVL